MGITLSGEKSAIPVRNFLKVRVLLYLNRWREAILKHSLGNDAAWQAISDIAHGIGLYDADGMLKLGSLYVIIPRWARSSWGYVDAHSFTAEQMRDNRSHTLYKINSRGLSYLNRLPKWYKYILEAEAALDSVEDASPVISPKSINWPAYPGSRLDGCCLYWPFAGKHDAHYCFVSGGKHVILVNDIDEAINTARGLFNIEPSQECVNYALAWNKYYAEKAGFKMTTRR